MNKETDLISKRRFEMLRVQNLKFKSNTCQAEMILNEVELYQLLNSLDQNKPNIPKTLFQLLDDKFLFYSFPNKDQAFEKYLTFDGVYSLKKFGKTMPIPDGEFHLSDFEYSNRLNKFEKRCL